VYKQAIQKVKMKIPDKDEEEQKRMRSLKPAGRAGQVSGLLFILLSAVALATTKASAQTLTALYSFTGGSDGADPIAGLIADGSQSLRHDH
jgi:hypothetical protein